MVREERARTRSSLMGNLRSAKMRIISLPTTPAPTTATVTGPLNFLNFA